MLIKVFDYVNIVVVDFDEMIVFYGSVLGLCL